MDSWGASAEMRRRSEEKLRGGEALDKLHGTAAKRTLPQRVNGQRRRGGARCWRMGLLEQARTEWKEFCSPPVSKKSKVADAHEAAWQQVKKEAAQELFDRQSHDPLLVAVGGVAPAKSDVSVGESNQPVVGDGDAVGVCAEIAQHMFWPAERPFGVDDPVVTEQYPQPRGEGVRFRKR